MPEVWAAFIEGKPGGEEALFRRFYTDLYRYALRLTGDESGSRDLVQELFLRLLEKRAGLPAEVASPRGYLLRMLRNQMIDGLRSDKIRTVDLEQGRVSLLVAKDRTMEQLWVARELATERTRKLSSALAGLSPAQREIVILRFYQELSFEDIETLTGLRYQTIRNYLSRGLQRLRATFAEKE